MERGERVGERKKDGGRLIWTEKLGKTAMWKERTRLAEEREDERGKEGTRLAEEEGDERGRWGRMENRSREIRSEQKEGTEKEGETDPCSLGG